MQVRLVPLSSLFRHFPRLVREIGTTLGKDLDLALQGEAIEVDKSLVDGLFEPILHLIRNAADHGIESAAARREAGKPVRGSITLGASRVLDAVVIEVADDGKGIDPAAVRRTAKDRGVLPDEALAALSDSETIDLLFMPGFSTVSTVTDLSGRGVGLDAVGNAVARLGGRIALSSRPGIGTSFRLSLPASVVLTGTIIVACAGESFGIPMETVLETLRLSSERVVPIRNGPRLHASRHGCADLRSGGVARAAVDAAAGRSQAARVPAWRRRGGSRGRRVRRPPQACCCGRWAGCSPACRALPARRCSAPARC
ncbi:MAG: ATP-binding protein [Aliidongia sp.]